MEIDFCARTHTQYRVSATNERIPLTVFKYLILRQRIYPTLSLFQSHRRDSGAAGQRTLLCYTQLSDF